VLKFHMTMDDHSLEVYRPNPAKDGVVDGSTTLIGRIMWHGNRAPLFEAVAGCYQVTLSDLQQIADRLEREAKRSFYSDFRSTR